MMSMHRSKTALRVMTCLAALGSQRLASLALVRRTNQPPNTNPKTP